MSDLKLYNLKKNALLSPQKLSKNAIQEIVERVSLEVFGLTIVASNYLIKENTNDVIETLAIDENNFLVIIEYRSGKFGKIINKGLMYIDYIKDHLSQFKMLISDKLGVETTKKVIFNPRLIIIGDDFNKYDDYAIRQMNYQIELIKYQLFDNEHILWEKNYQSRSVDNSLFTYRFPSKDILALYKLMSDFVLSLGDEVMEVGINNVLCYRKIKTFLYVTFNDEIEVTIMVNNKTKIVKIKKEADWDKIQDTIELAYDQN